MIIYVIILQIFLAVFYTPASGISMDTWKYSSCLKKHKYNCIQKCIWNQIGIIHHNVLQINSPQFKNQYKKQLKYDSKKVKTFKKCLKKSLKHLRIRKCDDIATIDSCYTSVRRNAKKRAILLSSYSTNKVVEAILDPRVEGDNQMLYNFGKAALTNSLTNTDELIAHDMGVLGGDIQHGVGSIKDGNTTGNQVKRGLSDLGSSILGFIDEKLSTGIGVTLDDVKNVADKSISVGKNAANSLFSAAKDFVHGLGNIGQNILGFVDDNLAKGIDTAADDVKSVVDESISVGKNTTNSLLSTGDQFVHVPDDLGIENSVIGFAKDTDSAVDDIKSVADGSISAGDEIVHGPDNKDNIGSSIIGLSDDTLAKGIDTVADDIKSVADESISEGKDAANQVANGLGNIDNIESSTLSSADDTLAKGIDTAEDEVKSVADGSISVGQNAANQVADELGNIDNIESSILSSAGDTLAKGIDSAKDEVKSVADGSISVGQNAANQVADGLGNIDNIESSTLSSADDTLAKGIDSAKDEVKSVADGSISVDQNAANQVADGLGNIGNIESSILGSADDTLAQGIDTVADDIKNVADESISVGKNAANQVANSLGNIGSSIPIFVDDTLAKGIDSDEYYFNVPDEYSSVGERVTSSSGILNDQMLNGLAMYNY